MNRRLVVKNLAWLAGAAVALPGCLQQAKEAKTSIPLKHLDVSASQEKMLAEVCEIIIPKTDTPGAKDLGLHRYVLKMLDDCTPKQQQQNFMTGLKQLEEASQKQYSQSFLAASAPQKLALMQRMDQGKDCPDELVSFYKTARQLTVDGYTNSKYFMTNVMVYELVPSRYNGYFPANKLKSANPHNG
jgi:hypothetical protein